MILSPFVALVAIAIGVEAQSTTAPPTTLFTSTTSTGTASSTAPATITVGVGASGFRFNKADIKANVGDTIEWVFYPDGHSVIRAEYGYPCTPYEYVDIGRQGFYSGQQPVKAITNDLPKFQITVNDTDPIFYYCGAPGSCFREKMIGVINANSTHTLAGQLKAAEGLTWQVLPGEPFPTESGAPPPPTATSTPTPTPVPTTGATGGNSGDDHGHLSAGAIAGIAIGAAAVLVLTAALIYLCGRRGGLDKAYRRSTPVYVPPPPAVAEVKYGGTPKSPGTETWSTAHYSTVPPPSDQYRDQGSPHGNYGPRSPPISPQHTPGYGTYPGGLTSPLMSGMEGQTAGFYNQRSGQGSPPLGGIPPQSQPVQHPPVELPTSEDPGNSPLPNYQPSRQFSWANGAESGYRPGK